MEKFRVHCKVHGSSQRVIKVVVGKDQCDKDTVWNWIKSGKYGFYATEKDYEAEVIAAEREGTRYLTTAPDKVTDNNLDELPICR